MRPGGEGRLSSYGEVQQEVVGKARIKRSGWSTQERSGRSGSPLVFRPTATFAIPAGIRIEVLVAAVAMGAVAKAIMFLGRFLQPAEYLETMVPTVSPDQGFDDLFDGDEPCFIFFRIQSWPPFRSVPWKLMSLSEVSGGIFREISHGECVYLPGIFSGERPRKPRMPYRSVSGWGGHPGMNRSTGRMLPTPSSTA